MKRISIIAFAIAIFAAFAVGANDNIKVSYVNFYPGQEIYELEGHSALRLQAPGWDVALTYGMFDFNSPNFLYRFVKGETDYCVAAVPWDRFALSYLRENRRIVEHELSLDSAQTARLLDLANENLLPENRVYRYNYVKDNCALRPLRLVQTAIGDTILLPKPGVDLGSDASFRQAMKHYHKNYPWYQFGIDLALGSGIDYPIDNWEMAFAPVLLDTQLPGAIVDGEPLVAKTTVLNPGADATLGPTPWFLTPMAVFSLLFVIVAAISIRDIRRLRISKWLDAILYSAFGIAGLLLTFLIFVSVHEATSPNILYIWLNPLCLIVPVLIWLKNCKNVVLSYQFVNFAMLIALFIAWPISGQSLNAAFFPLIACDMARSLTYIYVTLKKRE